MVEDYVSKLTHLTKEVCEANMALDDGEHTLIVLNGLDSTYDVFISAHTTRANNILFTTFQGLLQAHEARSSKTFNHIS